MRSSRARLLVHVVQHHDAMRSSLKQSQPQPVMFNGAPCQNCDGLAVLLLSGHSLTLDPDRAHALRPSGSGLHSLTLVGPHALRRLFGNTIWEEVRSQVVATCSPRY